MKGSVEAVTMIVERRRTFPRESRAFKTNRFNPTAGTLVDPIASILLK